MADARPYGRMVLGVFLLTLSGVAGYTAVVRAKTGVVPTPLLAVVPPSLALAAPWKAKITSPTVQHESRGRFDAMNVNQDGNGLSVGLISWAQGPGGLSELLEAWAARDVNRFNRIFGASAYQLRAAAKSTSRDVRMAPVGGVVLWREPWLSRFREALADPVFQQVQVDLVQNGSYMGGALSAASTLGGTPTERGLAWLYDTAVQQGTGAVRALARQVVALTPGADFATRARKLAEIAPARVASSPGLASDVARRMASIASSSLVTDATVA